MSAPDLPVSGAYVARCLGVTRATVSNWIRRGTLPEDLRPEMAKGLKQDRPVWRESQLPGLAAWLASHHPAAPRTYLTEVPAHELMPGDIVISTGYGLNGLSVTVRRNLEEPEGRESAPCPVSEEPPARKTRATLAGTVTYEY